MKTHLKPNRVIIDSIPLNVEFKKYWLRKYRRLERNNGSGEAQRKFKELYRCVLRYVSDPIRHENTAFYYNVSGFRTNRFLKAIFMYVDCQPHYLLNFLKFYTSDLGAKQKDPAAIHAAEKEAYLRLEHVPEVVDPSIPIAMSDWIGILLSSKRNKIRIYHELKKSHGRPIWNNTYPFGFQTPLGVQKSEMGIVQSFGNFVRHHSLEEWIAYWNRQYYTFQRCWTSFPESRNHQKGRSFLPEVYKDFDSNRESITADEDYKVVFHEFSRTGMGNPNHYLSRDVQDYVLSTLEEDIAHYLMEVREGTNNIGPWPPEMDQPHPPSQWDPLHYQWVGRVHQVKKKGSPFGEVRDIAVPCRIYQQALIPAYARMHRFQEILRPDASMNQSKFNTRITQRVTNYQSLYAGSIDLSKATDNLPFQWADDAVQRLAGHFGWFDEDERLSFKLFAQLIKAPWKCWGYQAKWHVGQPLGSLPSFGYLTLTHYLFLEALSLDCGLSHSPYIICGDDVVVFNKKLRGRYIRTMQSRHIPISLHKSYDRRMVEFAGQTYISNCTPFFTTDHSVVGWNNLFDYQRSTGIRIPWDKIPQKYRSRCTRILGKSRGHARLSYELAQAMLVPARGSSIWPMETIDDELISEYSYYSHRTAREREERVPDKETFSGVVNLMGHPVTLMNVQYANKDGHYFRYRKVEIPDWYKKKFRPCSTDTALIAASSALLAVQSDDN